MIKSGMGMGDSQIGAVGVRRELHVLLLDLFPLLVDAQQIGERVAEDDGPDRHCDTELNEAERVVRRQKAADEEVPRKPTGQWSKEDQRRLTPDAAFLRR